MKKPRQGTTPDRGKINGYKMSIHLNESGDKHSTLSATTLPRPRRLTICASRTERALRAEGGV